MKKLLSLLLLLALTLSLFACGRERSYTLGMGTVATAAKGADGQLTATVTSATVLLSPDGRIVACKIDSAENKLSVEGGVLPDSDALTFSTKKEIGDSYGMLTYGGAKAEWYAEVEAFEAFLVGKTRRDIAFLPAKEQDGGLYAVDEELVASCTIAIGDMLTAVKKAIDDPHAVSFTDVPASLGLSFVTSADASTPVSETALGHAALTTTLSAAALGEDGRVLAALLDVSEGTASFDKEGKLSGAASLVSKRELGETYGMSALGLREWYLQAASLADHAVGMAWNAIDTIRLTEKDGRLVAADETLYASCSIDISHCKEALKKAAALAAEGNDA